MESTTRLDYVLFQLTPTRTRCDLIIFAGKSNEKLAYGLLEPFVLHLRSAKDQIAKGGYSVTLRPPPASGNASWFTKGTLQRFVRFVSTPEVLERVVTIEREIQQIGDSIQSCEADGLDDDLKSAGSFKSKSESNGNTDGSQQENSKVRLQRVLDTRKAVLCKEQAMAYARALAAGYEMYNLDDLLSFADAFGASRLRDACINFIDLCKRKNEDRLWMDEIAAMQALPQPDLSYFGASGIVLAGEDNIQGGRPYGNVDTSASDSTVSHGSIDINADQMQSNDGKAQLPFPWANQLHYMQNFQGYQGMPPYQGYVFPGMQVPPPYYPNNMQWPPNANTPVGGDREQDDHQTYKSSKKKNRKRPENVEQNGDSEPSDSSTDSDSSTEQRNKKKREKKSSRKVVIRNINYITSNKNGDKAGSSDESSTDEDYLDGDSIKQQVEEAVGSLGKHHKTHHRSRKNGMKHNGAIHGSSDNENELLKSNKSKKGNENWDAFQQLLMREDSDSNEPRSIQVEESYHTTKSSGKQITSDAFLLSERDTSNDSMFSKGSIQNFEASESIRNLSRKGNNTEEFIMCQRNAEDYYSRVTPSDSVSGSSIMKGRGGDDYIISKMSAEAANSTSIDLELIDGKYPPPNGRDSKLKHGSIDDSLMVTRSMDDNFDTQLRFDMDMVSDSIGKASQAPEEQHDKSEATGTAEPEELYMVLDRGTSADYQAASWTPEMDFQNDIVSSEASKKQTDVDASVDTVTTSNGKDGIKKGRPTLTRDAKSRSLSGPPGRGKSDLAAKNSRPAWGSRAAANKSKLQKEEESRKRAEELMLQRQKRIAERSATKSLPPKKTTTVNRTKSGTLTEKPQVPSPNEETKKVQKPVLRSSTIDRLAAAKTVQKESVATSSKLSQTKKGSTKANGGIADKKKPSAKNTKPSDGTPESKNLNGIHRSVSDVDQVKDIPAESPPELTTVEDIPVPDTEDIKEMHITSSVGKYEEKPTSETSMDNVTGSNGNPVVADLPKPVTDLPKPAVDVETPHYEVVEERLVKICPPLTNADPMPEPPTSQVNDTVGIEENGVTNNITLSYREISEIEESTPPSHELNADPVIVRKKWITTEDPPKAKGFRKLLMFGKKRIQYA